uniref:DUF480 domain-containing protein n=1 Tax=Variovorax paradoxus TaxID=34073 RepID=UPI002479A16A
MTTALPVLSLVETRVLGVLAEKQRTVPDSYPLTLNALVSGCNQKTSRNPVLELSESQVQAAIDSLKGYSLVAETSGGRAWRYEHNIDRVLRIPSQSVITSPAHPLDPAHSNANESREVPATYPGRKDYGMNAGIMVN